MLRGHESLMRLVGKRQRNLSIQDVISSAAPSNPEVTGSSSSKVSIVAEEKLDATFEWVECPVCAKKIRGCDVYVNCHLDSCLDKPKKRSKRVQLTLLQFSSSKINREPFEEINQQSVHKETTHIEQPETFTYVSSNNLQASSSDHSLKRTSTEKENEAELGSNEALTMPADRVLYNGCLETRIAGRKYNGESRCEVGMQVSLVREPDNPKDPFAIKVIAVESTGGPSLGHIPRNVSCYLSPLMDENVLHIEGHVAAISKSEEVILKLNCEELQDRLILSPIKEKMLATNWEKAMSTSFENRSSRYRRNFVYLLNTVLERDSHLFNSGELQFLNGFYLLSECAQSLFVRLVQRKGPWFRVQNIDYEDVVNMSSAVQELVDRSFFLESKLEHTPELLELLTVQELKHLNYTANLMKKSCVSLAKKSELISLIIDTLKAQQSLLSENGLLTLILETLGTCLRISDETMFLLWRLQRLFFLDGEQELNVFLLVDMGRAKYPNYKCASTTPVFATREALLAYEQALKLAQAVDMSMEANDKDSLTLCLQKARDELEVITRSNSNVTHLFLCRFSAAWVYTAICTLAVSILEKDRRYTEAVDLLKQLLSTDYCTGRRGYWTMRLSIDLEHLQRCEESLQVAEKGLEDHFIRTGDRIGLQKRVLRLGKPPRRWRVPPFASMMKKKHKVVEILGRPLNNTIGMKSRFYGYDGNQCSVEELALQYYGDEGGGWKGIHSESGVWLTLFGLIMWDIIFMDVPDVFQTPFQNAPLDLDTDAFYTVRSTLIESRLKLVREGGGVDILTDTWQQNYGTFCRGVNWERCSLEDLQSIASCIGGPGLAVICKLLAEDHANWAAGMPDLLLWRPDHSDAKLVEVKGPSDRLSEQQEAWFIILAEADVHVELCKVSKQV